MTPVVIEVTPAELRVRRDEILGSLGLSTYDEFQQREQLGVLSDAEWEHVDDLRGIAFLLGEDASR